MQNLCVKQTLADTGCVIYANYFAHKNISVSSLAALLVWDIYALHHFKGNQTSPFLLFFYQQFNPEKYTAGENERPSWPVRVTEVTAQQTYPTAGDLAIIKIGSC